MKRIILLLVAISIAISFGSSLYIRRLIKDKQRLIDNQEVLLSDITLYRTEADRSAASVGVLTLQLDELRRQRASDVEQIKQLGIRLRRAESYARSVTTSSYVATTALRDSIIVRDTIRDTVRVFLSGDTWSRVEGVIRGDSLRYNVSSVDTLFQVLHRVPRRFLFFRYGTKAIRQEITSSNPHTTLVYAEYVELPHRRR